MTDTATAAPPTPRSIRFRGRSFMAIVLAPEAPTEEWLARLDAELKRSPGFFAGRVVILDVAALKPTGDALKGLLRELAGRDIQIMGVEGAEAGLLGEGMPPAVGGGRAAGEIEPHRGGAKGKPAKAAAAAPASGALVVDATVRSGQSIVHPEGDVVVLGSVGSGAEVIAGGSIHIYGALRGRAVAGSTGNAKARIFCRKLEAELLAIDGLYRTTEDMDPKMRGKPVQAWLNGDAMFVAALD